MREEDWIETKWAWLDAEIRERRRLFRPKTLYPDPRTPPVSTRGIRPWQLWGAVPHNLPLLLVAAKDAKPKVPSVSFAKLHLHEREPLKHLRPRPCLVLSTDLLHAQGFAWLAYIGSTPNRNAVRIPKGSCAVAQHVAVRTDRLPENELLREPRRTERSETAYFRRKRSAIEQQELLSFEGEMSLPDARAEIVDLMRGMVSEGRGDDRLEPDPDAPHPGTIVTCRTDARVPGTVHVEGGSSEPAEFDAVVLDSVRRREPQYSLVLTCRLVVPDSQVLSSPREDLLSAGRLLVEDRTTLHRYSGPLPIVIAVPLLRPVLRLQIVNSDKGNVGTYLESIRNIYHQFMVT